MGWSVIPGTEITSNTCRSNFDVMYIDIPTYMLSNFNHSATTNVLTISTQDVLSTDFGTIDFKVRVKPKYYSIPDASGPYSPLPITDPNEYGYGFHNANVTVSGNVVYLEGSVGENGGGSATIYNIVIGSGAYVYIKTRRLSNVLLPDWDDVDVTMSLECRSSTGEIIASETKTVSLGDQRPQNVGISYTWYTDNNRAEIDESDHIATLIGNVSNTPKLVKRYLGIKYYHYDNNTWTINPESESDLSVYAVLAADYNDILNLAKQLFGYYLTIIAVDPDSYQQYKEGNSSTLTVRVVNVLKQYNEFKIITGEQLSIGEAYSNNGHAWVEKETRTEGNYIIESVKGAYVKSQFRLDLSGIYGTSNIVNTPEFLINVQFPNCIAMRIDWTSDETVVDPDVPMPEPSTPESSIPDQLDREQYTLHILVRYVNSFSYTWHCEQTMKFGVMVYRNDHLSLSTDSYTISSVTLSAGEVVGITNDDNTYYVHVLLPQTDTTVSVNVSVTLANGQTLSKSWSFNVTEWGDRQLTGEVKTDKLYYDYGGSDPVEIIVTVYDIVGNPITGLSITDNWNNSYIDEGDGKYKATMDVSSLPLGQYSIFVKMDPQNQCYKSNLSEQFIIDKFTYNPVDFPNQDFKLTYPLVENITVTVNSNETTNYSTTLNQYGERILHIDDALNEGDIVEIKYQAYMTSTFFYIGSSEPITCTQVDEESISQYGRTPVATITVPFLQSQEEACEIASMYLQYYAKPTKVLSTDNKW